VLHIPGDLVISLAGALLTAASGGLLHVLLRHHNMHQQGTTETTTKSPKTPSQNPDSPLGVDLL
jgi:hypothetical protein